MGRGSRFKVLIGACIIGSIGILTQSTWLLFGAVLILVFSACARTSSRPPTNYTARYGPADSDEEIITPFMPGVVLDEEELDDVVSEVKTDAVDPES